MNQIFLVLFLLEFILGQNYNSSLDFGIFYQKQSVDIRTINNFKTSEKAGEAISINLRYFFAHFKKDRISTSFYYSFYNYSIPEYQGPGKKPEINEEQSNSISLNFDYHFNLFKKIDLIGGVYGNLNYLPDNRTRGEVGYHFASSYNFLKDLIFEIGFYQPTFFGEIDRIVFGVTYQLF
jgi:hypothetical protein